MSEIAIGDLRHRVTVERPLRTSDEGGAADITWQVVALVWAKVEGRGGQEPVRADTTVARGVTNITIRFRDDIDATMRIAHAGANYEIVSVTDADGHRRWLTCTCRAFGP